MKLVTAMVQPEVVPLVQEELFGAQISKFSITAGVGHGTQKGYQATFRGVQTQVNILKQIAVIDVSEERNEPRCLINPRIVEREGEETRQEGCLSVPGVFANVLRAEKIRVEALDREGQAMTLDADGLLAICIQHEIDHLEGKLFIDYLSPLKRQRIEKKLLKVQKAERIDSASRPSHAG